jgi:hypothetical protein
VTSGAPSPQDLAEVEALVRTALRGGDEARLRMLAWGEIGPVLGWPAAAPAFALKRLPPFGTAAAADAFATTLDDYIAALARHGLDCVPTTMGRVTGDAGVIGWIVQPLLPAETIGPALLRGADAAAGHPVLDAVLDADLRIPGPLLALDGQLSNFAWVNERLLYLDVTTPLLFDEAGQLRMDIGLLLGALPAMLRPAVRRWVVPDLLRRYRDPRAVVLDMLGNLIKERLEAWVPVALATVGDRLDRPITAEEVRSDYNSDARLWEVLLRLRRMDRSWQRRVRRRE